MTRDPKRAPDDGAPNPPRARRALLAVALGLACAGCAGLDMAKAYDPQRAATTIAYTGVREAGRDGGITSAAGERRGEQQRGEARAHGPLPFFAGAGFFASPSARMLAPMPP